MTNRIAIVLAALVLCLLALDLTMGWGGTIFLLRKLFAFLDFLIFWR